MNKFTLVCWFVRPVGPWLRACVVFSTQLVRPPPRAFVYLSDSNEGEVRYSPDTHIYPSEDSTTEMFGSTPPGGGSGPAQAGGRRPATPPNTPRPEFSSPRFSASSSKVSTEL